MTEAIDALRRSFAGSLLILGIFFFSLPVARQQLNLYEASRDLTAWLPLRERMKALISVINAKYLEDDDSFFSNTKAKEEIRKVPRPKPGPIRGPEDVTWTTEALTVSTEWPSAKSYSIVLTPIQLEFVTQDEVRLYQIESESSELPFADYIVVFARSDRSIPQEHRLAVVAAKSPLLDQIRVAKSVQLRFLEQSLPTMNRPRMWDRVHYKLTKYGFTGAPTSRNSTHASVHGLIAESDPRVPEAGVQILGIRLGLGVFFSIVGIFLGLLAFTMIGPIPFLAISTGVVGPSSWILLVPSAPGLMRTALEWLIVLLTMVWTLLPLAVLVLQLQMLSELAPVAGTWAVSLGGLGLAFSALVHAVASWELRRVRQRAGREVLEAANHAHAADAQQDTRGRRPGVMRIC